MTAPLAATDLDIGYDQVQDRVRLVARAGSHSVDLLVTRRLVRAVVAGLVELLMKTSAAVARAPADSRSEVLLFEHLGTLSHLMAEGAAPKPAAAPQTGPEAPVRSASLMTKIDITSTPKDVQLRMHDETGERATIVMAREKAHQFLAVLLDKAMAADWDLSEFSWMDRRGQVMVPGTMRLC